MGSGRVSPTPVTIYPVVLLQFVHVPECCVASDLFTGEQRLVLDLIQLLSELAAQCLAIKETLSRSLNCCCDLRVNQPARRVGLAVELVPERTTVSVSHHDVNVERAGVFVRELLDLAHVEPRETYELNLEFNRGEITVGVLLVLARG